jgi:aminopeptidase N
VRQAAAGGMRALARTRRLEAGEAQTKAVEALRAALDDYWSMTQYAALGALGLLGDSRAIPAIERYVAGNLDGGAVRAAREALAAIRRGQTRDQESRQLRTDVDELREEGRKLRERLALLEARSVGGGNGQANGATARPRRTRARRTTEAPAG